MAHHDDHEDEPAVSKMPQWLQDIVEIPFAVKKRKTTIEVANLIIQLPLPFSCFTSLFR